MKWFVLVLFVAGISPLIADRGDDKDQDDSEDSDRGVFKVSIIRCGPPGSISGCGLNNTATDRLRKGEVEVQGGGKVKVKLEGESPDTTYRIFVGYWDSNGNFQLRFIGPSAFGSLGTFRTDKDGDFNGRVKTDAGDAFEFAGGIVLGQPAFAFDSLTTGPSQFTTGFMIQ